MNINEYVEFLANPDKNEKPLDHMAEDGGLMQVFRTIGCIGDSLASGEMETADANGENKGFFDMMEYSWGQYMARASGCKVSNFSRGGMTAREFAQTFGYSGCFKRENVCQAYVIALGVNDLFNAKIPVGTADDMWDGVVTKEPTTTYAGYYNWIIKKCKELQPDAKFFLVNMPKSDYRGEEGAVIRKACHDIIAEIAKKHTNTYVIDLYEYMPENKGVYKDLFYLGTHLSPMGYLFTAKVIMSYIDYIIRHNYEDFIQVPFIGMDIHNYTYKW